MRKSIFFLFLLLIACTPSAITTPTSTPIPPTATAVPSPTKTPEPTATPSGFQVGINANIQIFEEGNWLDIKTPEGVWGPVDGVNMVLGKDVDGNDQVFVQMKLESGFVDGMDGDEFVNVGKFNGETKEWDVSGFAIARLPGVMKNVDSRNYWIKTPQEKRDVDYIAVSGGLIGLRVEGSGLMEVLLLHKNRVIKLGVNEVGIFDFSNESRVPKSVIPGELIIDDIIEMVRIAQKEGPPILLFDVNFNVAWEFPAIGVDVDGCLNRLGLLPPTKFIDWCENEILKSEERKIPIKAAVGQVVLRGLKADDALIIENADELWDLVDEITPIDNTWVRFNFLQQR